MRMRSRQPRVEDFEAAMAIILACFCALMIAVAMKAFLDRNEPSCADKGGIDLLTRSGYVCIKKDSIIR